MDTLRIRISDSVLDDRDFPVAILWIDDRVMDWRITSPGVYSFGPFNPLGMTVEEIAQWSCYDSTGNNPETYHEVMLKGEWQGFVTAEQIREELVRS